MSKSILLIGINYSPEITGIGKYTSEFATYLANKKDYQVRVITGIPYYPQWKIYNGYRNRFHTEEIEGAIVHRCPLYIPQKPTGLRRLIQDLLFFACAFFYVTWLIITRKRVDIVFIPIPPFSIGLLGLYYRFFFKGVKVVYHVQDLQIDAAEKLGMIKSNFFIKFLFRIEKYILGKVDIVSTISQGMINKIMSKNSNLKECLIFPNWIDSKSIYPILNGASIDEVTHLKNKKIVLYSGAIGEKQGLEIVIEAADFFRENSELVFVISGEGPYRQRLQDYAAEKKVNNVVFLNLLPLESFNKLLNASYLHLVLQKESGGDLFLPSKLSNILGVGGCVIVTASAKTSLYKIISGNKCGLVIPPSNKEELCNAIQVLCADDTLKDELKHNAFKYAQSQLYKASIIDSFLEKINNTSTITNPLPTL